MGCVNFVIDREYPLASCFLPLAILCWHSPESVLWDVVTSCVVRDCAQTAGGARNAT